MDLKFGESLFEKSLLLNNLLLFRILSTSILIFIRDVRASVRPLWPTLPSCGGIQKRHSWPVSINKNGKKILCREENHHLSFNKFESKHKIKSRTQKWNFFIQRSSSGSANLFLGRKVEFENLILKWKQNDYCPNFSLHEKSINLWTIGSSTTGIRCEWKYKLKKAFHWLIFYSYHDSWSMSW